MNVNGCRWCGELERGHGQRYDNLHPPGVHRYVAPSNTMRKSRLLLKISIRQALRGQGRRLYG